MFSGKLTGDGRTTVAALPLHTKKIDKNTDSGMADTESAETSVEYGSSTLVYKTKLILMVTPNSNGDSLPQFRAQPQAYYFYRTLHSNTFTVFVHKSLSSPFSRVRLIFVGGILYYLIRCKYRQAVNIVFYHDSNQRLYCLQ